MMRLRLPILFVLLGFLPLLSMPACSVMNTGPKMVTSTLEQSAGAAKALISAYQPKQMAVDIEASVTDPTYTADIFVGHGVLVRTILRLAGADLRFGIDSSGEGLPIDREFVQSATEIIGNSLLNEQERANALAAAFVKFLERLGSETPPVETAAPIDAVGPQEASETVPEADPNAPEPPPAEPDPAASES